MRYKLPVDASVLAALPALTCPVALSHAVEALLNPWHGSYSGGGPKRATA